MEIEHLRWHQGRWEPGKPGQLYAAQLVLIFGELHTQPSLLTQVRQAYPRAYLIGCSTAGEISGPNVLDHALVVTAIHFTHTELRQARSRAGDSAEAGAQLARQLDKDGLVHVFVLSTGLTVNGSALVAGLSQHLPPHVTITGGLAGDGTRFRETLVLGGADPDPESIIAIGFYSDRLRVGCGSRGGWEAFGPFRRITRSVGNVLYELDGWPALMLYQAYLGEQARDLPASGLLFPLSLVSPASPEPVVRTVLAIQEADQSITFAGDMPQGAYARFMRADLDKLVEGAKHAARTSYEGIGRSPDLAICISCVGRKLLLQHHIAEEVQGVQQVLGMHTVLTGFYSYGEIAPFSAGAPCRLHNQTMTITALAES